MARGDDDLPAIEPLEARRSSLDEAETLRVEHRPLGRIATLGLVVAAVAVVIVTLLSRDGDHDSVSPSTSTTRRDAPTTTDAPEVQGVTLVTTLAVDERTQAARLDFQAPDPAAYAMTVEVTFVEGDPADVAAMIVTNGGLELTLALAGDACGVVDSSGSVSCITHYPTLPVEEPGGWTAHLRRLHGGPVKVELRVRFERSS